MYVSKALRKILAFFFFKTGCHSYESSAWILALYTQLVERFARNALAKLYGSCFIASILKEKMLFKELKLKTLFVLHLKIIVTVTYFWMDNNWKSNQNIALL